MDAATVPGSMVLLTRLSRAVYRRSTEELIGMRVKPFVALNYLRDRDVVTQQQLGERLMMDANNVVLLLNELEELGFIVRRRDPVDRRRHIVEITPAGDEAIERAEAAMETIEDEVLAGLDAKERATLRGLLTKALESDPKA